MTMADGASKLDAFLQFNDAEVLQDRGKVTAAIAKAFAEEGADNAESEGRKEIGLQNIDLRAVLW